MMGRTESYRAGRTGILGILVACVVAVCHSPAARAQAVYLGLDANVPTVSSEEIDWDANDVDPGAMPIWVNIVHRSYLGCEGTHRFGFRFSRSRATLSEPFAEAKEYPYNQTTWEATFDKLAFRSDRWLLTAGAGLGWCFVSEDYSTGNPDAVEWFPDACWVLTPEVRVIYDSKLPVSGFISVRAPLRLSGDDDTLFPFANEPVFSLGLVIQGGKACGDGS